ncbi:pentapeptide repeat-containing protein [Salinibacter ruber]|uniref:pentapeptide repeat-containing protein n=1 Tax=Salinibacter ruber TaxID=146919 RepID=UPI003C6E8D97
MEIEEVTFNACEFNGDALFNGESEENRDFADVEIDFRDVTIGPGASLRFRYADLSRCRFLHTDLRDAEFTGVKWCEEVSKGEISNRKGLFEETAEENSDGTKWVDEGPAEDDG